MNLLKATLSAVLLLAIIILLNTKFGSIPPIGKFVDPDGGFWANAELAEPESEELNIPGLKEEVSVYYDERRVPHIFAKNNHDLYLAQGYVVARDRLFQLEMQTYDAAGRLSEIIGPQLLNRDLQTRRWGMPYGAEKGIEEMKKDSLTWESITAYSDGINAYINQLSPKNYPLEYKVLNIAPEAWEPLKSALLLKNMTRILAVSNNEFRTGNTLAYLGEDFLEKFFTVKPKLNDPIVPDSEKWNFNPELPTAPGTLFIPTSIKSIQPFQRPEGIGSNNWAVSGEKTASGNAILANDPHLGLTLPSIWYEAQLNAPGVNTYGVTLQGSPNVIVGFNEHAAWGTTNVGSDVMDWFEIKFKDDSKQEYWHGGEWKKTTIRVEEIKVRGEETVLDTVIYTHHGPVSEVTAAGSEEKVHHALHWIAHYPSNDVRTFYEFNRAKTLEDFKTAASHYVAPAQNFVFANQDNDIAIWISGKLPKKWEFQGRMVGDGTNPLYDWQGWIPFEQNPHQVNPERGFVSSANQESAAENYPYYLDDDFAPFERGRRINERLEEMENITVEDMQKLQMDNFSYFADTYLSSLLSWTNIDSLNPRETEVYNLLANWDYMMEAEQIAPTVFRQWANEMYNAVFNDEFSKSATSLRYVSRDRFVEVITQEPDFEFIDNIDTEKVETREDIALESFRTTILKLTNEYGEDLQDWRWGYDINNDIDHIASIPGMGVQSLWSSGSSDAVNATRGGNGPSWRMVVELGDEVKGYGVYPGGASGNPGSKNYDSMVENWRKGELFELNFYREQPDIYSYKLSLKPEAN